MQAAFTYHVSARSTFWCAVGARARTRAQGRSLGMRRRAHDELM